MQRVIVANTRQLNEKCVKCGKPIREGQELVSNSNRRTKHYHKKCWDSMFY